jgi:hypothetical protein
MTDEKPGRGSAHGLQKHVFAEIGAIWPNSAEIKPEIW